MSYQQTIRETLARQGRVGQYDPRHIEAYMRCEYGTLDHLSRAKFDKEIAIAAACVDAEGVEIAERLALSEGL